MSTQKLRKNNYLHVRMRDDVKTLLQKLAEMEGRSTANWVERRILDEAKEKGLINGKEKPH